MEVFGVMSPPYTGFLRQFDPRPYFHRGVNRANYGLTSNSPRLPVVSSRARSSRPKDCDQKLPVLKACRTPVLEPLDLTTRKKGAIARPELEISAFSGTCGDRVDSDGPAKLVPLKFCECFTGKHDLGEYFACYCNENPVFIHKSKLSLQSPEMHAESVLSSVSSQTLCDQQPPSMVFSSLDSPPPLMIDLSQCASDNEADLADQREKPIDQTAGSTSNVAIDVCASEAQRVYEFASDEELTTLGTFSKFRLHSAPIEDKINISSVLASSVPKVSGDSTCVFPTQCAVVTCSDMEITQNVKMSSPSVEPVSESVLDKTMCLSEVSEPDDTQNYNADISATQLNDTVSFTPSPCSIKDVDSVWFVKQSVDKLSSPLKIKLCKTFVVSRDTSNDLNNERQKTENSDTTIIDVDSLESVVNSQTIKEPAISKHDITSHHASRAPCMDGIDVKQLDKIDKMDVHQRDKMDVTQRLVEGRSICEASTIFSASPLVVDSTPMSPCVSRPSTPDVSCHQAPKMVSVTPKNNHFSVANRKSSTPNVRGPITMKDVYNATNNDVFISHQTSLRTAMFKSNLSPLGSDSILNLGFTSTLESEPHGTTQHKPRSRHGSGSSKKSKPKWLNKTSILKKLKEKLTCRSNTSVMSMQDRSMLPELSCSERVKAALDPLTVRGTKPSLHIPLRGKTATCGTATLTFATLTDTKQLNTIHSTGICKQREVFSTHKASNSEAALPSLKPASSVRSLGTSTTTLDLHPIEINDKPLDLSSSRAPCLNAKTHQTFVSGDERIHNKSNPCPGQIENVFTTPKKSNIACTAAESSPFKIPRVPCSPRNPKSRHQVCPLASLTYRVGDSTIYPIGTAVTSASTTESSMSESNMQTWPTQQSLDIQTTKCAAQRVGEIVTAFVGDASMAQFGVQFHDRLSKSMLLALCEKCDIRVKESRVDPTVMRLVKSRRSRAPTQEDVNQLVRRARRTRQPTQLLHDSSMFYV
ncbi:hypothetical protein PoB_005977100 [Plakobranchus ocellatus]|uniref:Uncharacterized protein n=1 Tax=Plakobranchus ocellatus TaxID=259542 RepID=A0AAV4CD67_9GAST|nr:hypothetical protein PoB_005977100 [Plakobranchus ocellatus]